MFQCPPVPESTIKTLVPVISALAGGVIGIGGSYITFLYQRRSERKSITAAFAGEIFALLEILEKRNYIGIIRQDIENIRSGSRMTIAIPVTQTYFNVYFKNLDKIGLLKASLSSKIVEFYTTALGVLEDFKTLEADVPWESDEQYIQFLKDLISTIEHAKKLGLAVLRQINK